MTAIISMIAILGLFAQNQWIAIISIFIIGLGFANIFPLIFSITVDNMPERSNELSGLMVTAIIGGAILPFFMGGISDLISVQAGLRIPLLAITYILFISTRNTKRAQHI